MMNVYVLWIHTQKNGWRICLFLENLLEACWCYGTVSSILLLNTDLAVTLLSLASPGILALYKFDWLIVWKWEWVGVFKKNSVVQQLYTQPPKTNDKTWAWSSLKLVFSIVAGLASQNFLFCSLFQIAMVLGNWTKYTQFYDNKSVDGCSWILFYFFFVLAGHLFINFCHIKRDGPRNSS